MAVKAKKRTAYPDFDVATVLDLCGFMVFVLTHKKGTRNYRGKVLQDPYQTISAQLGLFIKQ